MRESQYTDDYLAETGSGHLVTPGTYLHGVLRGRQKEYAGNYHRALMAALQRRVENGTVAKVQSAGGSDAYIRTGAK